MALVALLLHLKTSRFQGGASNAHGLECKALLPLHTCQYHSMNTRDRIPKAEGARGSMVILELMYALSR